MTFHQPPPLLLKNQRDGKHTERIWSKDVTQRQTGGQAGPRLRRWGVAAAVLATAIVVPIGTGIGAVAQATSAQAAARRMRGTSTPEVDGPTTLTRPPGRSEVAAVEDLAFWLGLVTAAIPILVVAAFFLPLRWRFVRRASAGQRFVDANEDLDLFALRALAHQPMHVLARVSDDPAGAWRERDPDVVRRLAALELADAGLRPKNLPAA